MRWPGRKSATQGLRWLRSRFQRRIVVLGYHRISDSSADRHGLAVAPHRFEQQMAAVVRLARVIRLKDLADAFAATAAGKPQVVVTFDDGYADNLSAALPVLERFGIPATVFVVSGYLGREFWWDELARLEPVPDSSRREAELAALSDNERRPVLDRLVAECRWRAPAPLYRALTTEELRQLASTDLVEIGAHTATHRVLPGLPLDEQRWELQESRRVLQTVIGSAVTCFSYPHGAVSGTTMRLVTEAGFSLACCSKPDVVTVRSDMWAVPRFWVQDWSGDQFETFLRRWLGD